MIFVVGSVATCCEMSMKDITYYFNKLNRMLYQATCHSLLLNALKKRVKINLES